jgi:hypothetical protein
MSEMACLQVYNGENQRAGSIQFKKDAARTSQTDSPGGQSTHSLVSNKFTIESHPSDARFSRSAREGMVLLYVDDAGAPDDANCQFRNPK